MFKFQKSCFSKVYIAVFCFDCRWLDKLGLSAAHGVDLVIRQTFFGGYYGLLDEEANPTPV